MGTSIATTAAALITNLGDSYDVVYQSLAIRKGWLVGMPKVATTIDVGKWHTGMAGARVIGMRIPSRSVATAWSSLALLFLALMAWQPTRDALQTFDDQVWEWAVSAERPAFVRLAEILDVAGSTVAMAFVTALVAGALWWRGCRWQAAAWTLAMVIPQLINISLKYLYERPRPPMPLINESTWSFPSGHSVLAAAVITAAFYVILTEEQIRRVWLVSGAIYVAAVAFSRVYLRVHWLSDVAAGVAEGVAVATVTALIVGLRLRRRGAGAAPDR